MLKSLLSRARHFFDPKELTLRVISAMDNERLMLELELRPRVLLVMDRAVRQWDPEAPSLEELGYEMYDREFTMMASYYARRPWLWLLKAGVWVRNAAWRLLSATRGRLWHMPLHRDGCRFRWRDARPGSGALEAERAAAASLRARAHELCREVDELRDRRRADYMRGQVDGWGQRQQALERSLNEELG